MTKDELQINWEKAIREVRKTGRAQVEYATAEQRLNEIRKRRNLGTTEEETTSKR